MLLFIIKWPRVFSKDVVPKFGLISWRGLCLVRYLMVVPFGLVWLCYLFSSCGKWFFFLIGQLVYGPFSLLFFVASCIYSCRGGVLSVDTGIQLILSVYFSLVHVLLLFRSSILLVTLKKKKRNEKRNSQKIWCFSELCRIFMLYKHILEKFESFLHNPKFHHTSIMFAILEFLKCTCV